MSDTKNTDAEVDKAVEAVLAESDDWVEDPTPAGTKTAPLGATIAVRLDADTHQRLRARSEARGIGYSALVRELIDDYLAVEGLPVSEAADELLRLLDEARRTSGKLAAEVHRALGSGIRGTSKDVVGTSIPPDLTDARREELLEEIERLRLQRSIESSRRGEKAGK